MFVVKKDDKTSFEENTLTNPFSDQQFAVYVSTHPGAVRSENEDNFVINDVIRTLPNEKTNLRGYAITEPLVCGVFDGMGGESNGKIASQLASKASVTIYKTLRKHPQQPDDPVNQFVKDSNQQIVEMLADTKSQRGGSTFVLVALLNGMVHVYSLGDSRLYLYSSGKLSQITNDHTLGMKKYYANIYTIEEAMSGPDSHKLTSFLGMDTEGKGLNPEKYPPFQLALGEKLLLCSDGLYDMCSNEEINEILGSDSDIISLDLVKRAIKYGGIDNVTCIVIERTK